MCYKQWSADKKLTDETKEIHLMREDKAAEFEEKVWGYVRTHKKPIQAKTLAKLWIVSDNKVARALASLVEKGKVRLERVGTSKFYRAAPDA